MLDARGSVKAGFDATACLLRPTKARLHVPRLGPAVPLAGNSHEAASERSTASAPAPMVEVRWVAGTSTVPLEAAFGATEESYQLQFLINGGATLYSFQIAGPSAD